MSRASPKRRIGILGGMGPQATVLLMQRIIDRTSARDDRDHVPMLVDNNTQVPSRIAAIIEGTGESPAPVLVEMARRLEAGGAEALAMPCNTAHHYAGEIAAAVSVPFLDMIDLSVGAVAGRSARRVGILGSPAVRLAGIFDRTFAGAGIATLYPGDEAAMLAAIRLVKAGDASGRAAALLRAAAAELHGTGADVLVVACTEFSVIAGAIAGDCPVVDTLDVLAGAVVAFASADRGPAPRFGEA
ncbi:aspartate/glutamate racemase family protein [Jiella sonneratiae]|uniref:Aspartate/glutamate racemase family protein n=1 Tax=Jiella sonneratiae TaxID=2816856 RepID=A0ABS3IYR7_9HYPH|nr:amino acid racemase [Jiella sonneratiae]MBO0902547.1 aspartate/glutamate racemase family protein [Jiella sonneratiae]